MLVKGSTAWKASPDPPCAASCSMASATSCGDKTDSSPTMCTPFARKSPNQSLFIAIVADCGPRRVHAAAGRCFQHDASVPDGLEEIVAAHHAVPGTNEEFQHIENLRLDRNQAAAAAKLPPVGIKDTILDPVEQDRSPLPML